MHSAAGTEELEYGQLGLQIFILCLPSLAVWAAIARDLWQRRPLMAAEPRHLVPWRWTDVLIAFVLYLMLPALALALLMGRAGLGASAATPPADSNSVVLQLAANAGASLTAAVFVALMLVRLSGANLSDLGLSRRGFGGDILHGVVAFLAVAPLLFYVKWLFTYWFPALKQQPHPLEESLREHPTPTLFFWATVVAVVVAPVVEEFLFRVILQGWLERCFAGQDGDPEVPADAVELAGARSARIITPAAGWGYAVPIVISSTIFALFHIGHGADPIPLFLLALTLGYLYQKTHRLLPCVVVHLTLNALSMLQLALLVRW